LDGVRQALDLAIRARLEEQRSAPVERQLRGDSHPSHRRVFKGGDCDRQGLQLSTTAANCVATQRRFRSSAADRAAGLLDSVVERGGNPTSGPRSPKVISSPLMRRAG
jgi:hypothetical protein